MNPQLKIKKPRFKIGFSLIEVLVAWVILSFTLLSLSALQIVSLRKTFHSYARSIATLQALSWLEQLRANYSDSDAVRQDELNAWNKHNRYLLPGGHGNYRCHLKFCTVYLWWGRNENSPLSLSTQL